MRPRPSATRTRAVLAGLIASLASLSPALADDTEVFFSQGAARGIRPNVLFIVDTSGSMASTVQLRKRPYDAAVTYPGSCPQDTIYVTRAGGDNRPPSCETASRTLPASANACAAARDALGGPAGFWTGKASRWDPQQTGWRRLQPGSSNQPLECEADAGRHGEDASSPRRWARNGDAGNRWTSNSGEAISWAGSEVYTLYGANYLNWYHAPDDPAEVSRLDLVKSVGTSLAYSMDGINLGLMRFSPGDGSDVQSEGGMVTHEVAELSESRARIAQRLSEYTPGGWTPLSETLYEAGQYFAGRSVDYGINSTVENAVPFPSVPESRQPADPGRYRSPVEYQCQRSFIVLLTDGEPVYDQSADTKIPQLPGFGQLGRNQCDGEGDGRCLDDMAEYLSQAADVAPTLPGRQNVTTFTIGFGEQVAGSALLEDVARRGGGRAFSATDLDGLNDAIRNIFGDILQTGSTFVSPSVSINAFNRTQTNNELYVSVFKPDDTARWRGNVKKYALRGGRIVDASGAEAVDPTTGFLRGGTRSLWSAGPESDVVEDGGAASRLPDPTARRVYTYIATAGQRDLTAAANALVPGNDALSDAVLNTGDDATREDVIAWARGVDSGDLDFDGDRAEPSRSLGDPLHARPAVVTYGGAATAPDPADAVVFVPTNDGYLHALDARSGRELWSFVAPELLGRLVDLYRNASVAQRGYGLDGEVRVLKFDVNEDGVVDRTAGDRVWLFFGMRRGGRHYYALDVTDRNRPVLRWSLGPGELPGVGESWSTPTVTRMRVQGATQNGENIVLVFGGGYDEAQDGYQYAIDRSGHRIYVVDAASGALLWFAGGPGGAGTPDLPLARMTHSIPGRVVAIDTDGDRYADRLYAGDMGGRLWRFDVWNGRPRSQLVTGGVLASLGAADASNPSIADTRRFYSAPDVALIQRRGALPYYNLAIGSGYRGHPLHAETRDRFYSVRDRNPFGKLTQAQYDSATPIRDGDLVDITSDPGNTRVGQDARGWKLELRLNGGWSGEKVLAEATTIDGTVLFTTYQPNAGAAADPCLPASGTNRAYALKADNGRPAVDFNDDAVIDAADVSTQLVQSGIAGEVTLALESGISREPDGAALPEGTDPLGRRGLCVVGVEVLRRCVVPGSVVRTWWQRTSGDGPP